MIPLRLSQIAAIVHGELIGDDATVDRVVTDSRALEPASLGQALFVALRSDTGDGHDYIEAAIGQGAKAVLCADRRTVAAPAIVVDDTWQALHALAAHVRDAVGPLVVAITGSVGKTTVKDLASAALRTTYTVTASHASFNNELGVPLTLLAIDADTDVVVVEIGARHPGDIAALAGIVRPDVAVITAVAPAHLGPFGSIEAIAATKAELVEALDDEGVAILNVAWPHVAAMASRAQHVIRVGGPDDADVAATEVHLDGDAHARIAVRTPWGSGAGRAPVVGAHQVANVLLAVAIAGQFQVAPQRALDAIAQASISPMRGDVHAAGARTVIDDAYNANPASMAAALEMLVARAQGRPTVAVLGEMAELGAVSQQAHVELGRQVGAHRIGQLVVCGSAAAGIASGARQADGVTETVVVGGIDEAVAWVLAHTPDNAVVLVKASRSAGLDAVVRGICVAVAEAGQDARSECSA